ncbi:hypothetical protein ACI68E_001551 [Malassezia pachydermatis]|uniref:Allergen n=1 Tax=Malassezia pachydermatis TaxID=77020 RepID=A0A0M8MSW1_9BASI|nr:hypothetical protein Malapachy_3190 [Malassezia pachydermatis]KOS16087.1 hypothetical protein Malapachy_3190 [Malassezia pachydermatis]
MSNVIRKVFNTDKNEATTFSNEASNNASGTLNNTSNNATHNATGVTGTSGPTGTNGTGSTSDYTPLSAWSVQNGGQTSVGASSTASAAAQAAAAADSTHAAPSSQQSTVPQSQSIDSANRTGLTQTTSVNSGVNVAAGNVDQDVQHLAPVTRHIHHRHEVEELIREREHHIHQHHIQHHVQPVLDSEHLAEQIHSRVVPVTTVREVHANTDKDAALMRAVAGNPKDTFTQAAIDRSVIDKGETVREIVHHHIHNIVQPIIEKETHEYHRIRTTIPTTHITHEAPIVHESTAHQPIRKEDFLKGGGVLTSTTRTIEEAGLLNLGNNQRTVEGETYTGGMPLGQ